jgi:integrase
VAIYPAAQPSTRVRQVYTPIAAVLHHSGITDFELSRPKGSKGHSRTTWLAPERAFALLHAAEAVDAQFGALCTFLLYTGCRLGEALALSWGDVDLSAGMARVHMGKVDRSRTVHLPPPVVAALANLDAEARSLGMHNARESMAPAGATQPPVGAANLNSLCIAQPGSAPTNSCSAVGSGEQRSRLKADALSTELRPEPMTLECRPLAVGKRVGYPEHKEPPQDDTVRTALCSVSRQRGQLVGRVDLNSAGDRDREPAPSPAVPSRANPGGRHEELTPLGIDKAFDGSTAPAGHGKPSGRVFRLTKNGRLYAWWATACQTAGIVIDERVAFHCLRHTYATWMKRYAGADADDLLDTGAWADRTMVRRYAHSDTTAAARKADLLPVPERRKA